jgi:hypothetical protein
LIKPDAFDPTTNTVYEFYGDYWHGNPNRFNLDKIHHIRKVSLRELYEKTITREQLIISAGYKIISMWELDWKNVCKT